MARSKKNRRASRSYHPLLPLVFAGGTVLIALVLLGRPQTGEPESGWCCVEIGRACVPRHTVFSCQDRRGVAFTSDQDNCAFVCHSPTSNAGRSAP